MNQADIEEIEQALSITLPQSYRDIVCPFPLKSYAGNSDTDLWDDAASIIRLNRDLRDNEDWLHHLYAMGRDGGGAMHAIDLSGNTNKVVWIDRDLQAVGTGPLDQSIEVWGKDLINSMTSGEYMDGFDPENDSPETRLKAQESKLKGILGCLGMIIVISVVGSLLIFGVMVLLGY